MPAAKRKAKLPESHRRAIARGLAKRKPRDKKLKAEFNSPDIFKRPYATRAHYEVNTEEAMGVVSVGLEVLGDDRNQGPDQRTFVRVASRFPADPSGLYRYPPLTVRACELDDLVLGLQAAIEEGRKRFVIPPAEPRDRTFNRITNKGK